MLEAREACSGASGRNAGHCRPDAYRGFTAFSRKHGEQDAMEILESERTVYELCVKIAVIRYILVDISC